MDILNFISWIRGKRQVTTVDPAKTLLPVGIKDPKRDDEYIAGAITVEDFAAQIAPPPTPSTNIYNSDGTLTGNRTIDCNNYQIFWNNASYFQLLNNTSNKFFNVDFNNNSFNLSLNNFPFYTEFIINNNNILLGYKNNINLYGIQIIKNNRTDAEYTIGNAGTYGLRIRNNNNGTLEFNVNDNQNILRLSNNNSEIENQYGRFSINNQAISLTQSNVDGAKLRLDITNNRLFTYVSNTTSNYRGIFLDYNNRLFQFGQINGGNTTTLKIDDAAAFPLQVDGANVSANTAGAASGQFLKIKVNGVDYKIALLNP
jgi:hypothetical protein